MAISHCFRRAGNLDLNGSAKTFAFVCCRQNMNVINADLHINGVHEIKMASGTWNATTRTCSNTGCHGTKSW